MAVMSAVAEKPMSASPHKGNLLEGQQSSSMEQTLPGGLHCSLERQRGRQRGEHSLGAGSPLLGQLQERGSFRDRSPMFQMQESKGELVGCRVPAQSPCSCAPHSTAPTLHPTATLLPRSDETSRHQRGGNGASTAGDAHSQPVGRSQSAEDAKSPSPSSPSTQQHGTAGARV